MEYFGYVASLIMGIVLGLIGGGGSILTVPILVYLFSLSPMLATGYSLFVVGTTALIGSLIYIRKGDVNFRVGLGFAVPSVIGVNISRGFIIPKIPSQVAQFGDFVISKEILIMVTFAVIMLTASLSMINKKSDQKDFKLSSVMRNILLVFQGLFVGLIAGFVGAGGGFLIIPALVFMARLPMRIAVGTSLMTIALQSLLGFAGDLSRGMSVDWQLLSLVAMFAIGGIIVGSLFSHKIKEKKLKTTFGWFVLVMGLAIFAEQIRHL